MKKITPQEIEAGMVLADDVIGPTGGVLMQAGMALSPSLGRRLKNWDIPFLYVEGITSQEEEGTHEVNSRDEIQASLNKRFSHSKHNAHMRALFDAIIEFRMSC